VRNPNTRRGKKTDQEGDAEKGEWRGAWWIGEQQGLMRKEKKRMWRHARVWEKKMAIEHKVTSNNSTHRHTNSTMQIIERQCKAQKGSGTRI